MAILMFILGLIFGSFITAFVWRLHDKRDFIRGRSVCESCKKTLEPVDLIPILSWLVLQGRCRHCKQPISWQYPLIELVTGLSFLLSYVYWPQALAGLGNGAIFVLWLVSVVLFVSLAIYDAKWMLLPDKIMWPLIAAGMLAVLVATGLNGFEALKDAIIGVAISFGFFYLLAWVSKGKWIGGGDVKFGIVMGLWLGAIKSVVALLLGFYSAALTILPLLVLGKITRKSRIPFGPFLIAGTFAAMLFGKQLADWYQNLILL